MYVIKKTGVCVLDVMREGQLFSNIKQLMVSKHQIQPEYEDEHADAGRDCRTRLARLNSQARTGTGKY